MAADDSARTPRWKLALDLAATVAMVAASGVLIWAVFSARATRTTTQGVSPARSTVGPTRPLPSAPISLDGAAQQGEISARFAVVEYLDFECPFCVRFATTTLPTILKAYIETGKVRFAFRHLPLAQHASALMAAEAAECARRQEKFQPMHDALFTVPRALDSRSLFAKAQNLGLELNRFQQCMGGEATDRVRQDVAEALALGITGTPTFLFGTIEPDGRLKVARRESGAIPATVFARMLDDLVQPALRVVRH